jgi:isoleucyl-tRNA synthetase
MLRPVPRAQSLSCRSFSWTARSLKASEPSKKYSDTLLLPKTSFSLYGDPEKSEVAFRKKTSDELYRWQVSAHIHIPSMD